MILEIHSHTSEHSSCSQISAAELVGNCHERDLQGIVLTDHHYLWPGVELDGLIQSCGVPEHFIILAGQEVTTSDMGDVLVYGAPATIAKYTPLTEIRMRFPLAALVLAHPFRNGREPTRETLSHPALDAIEIFNANQSASENYRALQAWHQLKFTAVSGTDVHAAGYCATYPTDFQHPVRTVEELAEEIRMGRCRPLLREIPRSGTSNLRVTELELGRSGTKAAPERLIIKTHADLCEMKAGSRTQRIMDTIAEHGFDKGTFRIPRPLGRDESSLVLIEQGITGQSLFDKMLQATPDQAVQYIYLSAAWLARLHHLGLEVTPPDEFLTKEPERLRHYTDILSVVGHRHARRIEEIRDKVLDLEFARYNGREDLLVQGHGDYHPKNIFIGQDSDDPDSRFAAAIDLNSSYQLPPAFDVGTFLAQYSNQFQRHPRVLQMVPPRFFLHFYLKERKRPNGGFMDEIELFKARTCLSIIYYLVKVGLGESQDLWRVLVSAEQSLTRLAESEWYGQAGEQNK